MEESVKRWIAFLEAALTVSFLLVACLLCGCDISPPLSETSQALLSAVERSDVQRASNAISAGARLDATNSHGLTALHQAVLTGQVDMVRLLLDRGANADIRGNHGWTPLHIAADLDRIEIASLLLAHGASVNALDDSKQSPVLHTAYNGSVYTAMLLIGHGGNPDIPRADGETPLSLARASESIPDPLRKATIILVLERASRR
jgi:ankyrin repeat protein